MTKSKFKKLAEINKAMDKEMLETISAAGNTTLNNSDNGGPKPLTPAFHIYKKKHRPDNQ
jgi:hypothetical protein